MDPVMLKDIMMALLHPNQAIDRYKLLLKRSANASEIFYRQPYHWLAEQLKPGTTVIDIGANIGDTAIYFAQFNEVRKVIAYEPLPYLYGLMLENLRCCQIGKKVVPKNEAVSDAHRT